LERALQRDQSHDVKNLQLKVELKADFLPNKIALEDKRFDIQTWAD
jgi:hypothetical protein